MIYNRSVSVPYEITLLSNRSNGTLLIRKVSVPYEITLLSNEDTYTNEHL